MTNMRGFEVPTRKTSHVCLLVDESASMAPQKEKTISGINEYIQSLKKDQGDEVRFTLTFFNEQGVHDVFKNAPIEQVMPIIPSMYNPDHNTPLYDAIGSVITQTNRSAQNDELVIFAILTDGEENSSKSYNLNQVKALLETYQGKGWKFAFLGVGIDAFRVFGAVGASRGSTFNAAPAKMDMVYDSMSVGATMLRSSYASNGLAATANMAVISEEDRDKLK